MCGAGGKALWLAFAASLTLHILMVLMGGLRLDEKPSGRAGAGVSPQRLTGRLVTVLSQGLDSSSLAESKPGNWRLSRPKTQATHADNIAEVPAGLKSQFLRLNQAASPLTPHGDETNEDAGSDDFSTYVAADALDIIPTPVTAPDIHVLNGMQLREAEVLVKLYVDAAGVVRHVVTDVPEGEQNASQSLQTMFEQTAFVPGRRGGKAVASVLAIQIDVQELGAVRYFSNSP